jgi:hypothetical protein
MSTVKILDLVGQEKNASYKACLRDEVFAFTKELAKRARVDPPLLPNSEFTEAADKELQDQVRPIA